MSQVLQAINSAIAVKVLPTLQSSLEAQGNGFGANVDARCSGRHRSLEVEMSSTTTERCSKMDSKHSNQNHCRRETPDLVK